ncbi:DUF4007 family protein [Armatimonas rosea]|uniref:DUF4007 domain-containing protein n=1 Tax=Armatimonas rosea TaxID=685828 RepID=A0A7W9SRQ3_ARMRO|nr:DUF4007 family protein [Armatimonas rosea]MBB6050759.1 hypothetical protein [Armatimonas rosea]
MSDFPTPATFSGHETFTFRYPWLKKGVDGVRADSAIFQRDEAIVKLGVGKNMVTSIRHWCLATGMIQEKKPDKERRRMLERSELGTRLLSDNGWDAYLEREATLWLLHWQLVTNPNRATTWHGAFHLFNEPEFTRKSLANFLMRLAEEKNWGRVSPGTVESDVACFIRTYVPVKRGVTSTQEDTLDCPLTELALLQMIPGDKDEDHRYRFQTRPKRGLSPAIFAYALASFWEQHYPNQGTLSLREILHGAGSPGRAFRLDEQSVLNYLDALSEATGGALGFEDTALIRQAVRVRTVHPLEILERFYVKAAV